jgi:hypothetical protein
VSLPQVLGSPGALGRGQFVVWVRFAFKLGLQREAGRKLRAERFSVFTQLVWAPIRARSRRSAGVIFIFVISLKGC